MPEFSDNNLVLAVIAACAAGVVSIGLLYVALRRDRRKYVPVGVVSRIYVHPIKSCRGLEVSQAECVALGIRSNGVMDRSFLIVDANGVFVTQRQQPSLALIAPSVSDDKRSLLINAPGMPTLTVSLRDKGGPVADLRVWKMNVKGEDCGAAANEWLGQYLGVPDFKLMRHQDNLGGKVISDNATWGFKSKPHEKCIYHDIAQVNILSQSSLADLNSRLSKPMQLRNFRPNIVIEGTAPFSEDQWKYVRIGDSALLRTTHMCGRCRETTVDPDTGKFFEDGNPLKTLKEFRMATAEDPDKKRYGLSPLFGTNLAVECHGTIKLGDTVYASVE